MPYSPNATARAARGHARAARVVLLAVLDPAWDEHGSALRRLVGRLGGGSSAVGAAASVGRVDLGGGLGRDRPRRRPRLVIGDSCSSGSVAGVSTALGRAAALSTVGVDGGLDRGLGAGLDGASPDAARPASVLTPVVPCEPERRGRRAGRPVAALAQRLGGERPPRARRASRSAPRPCTARPSRRSGRRWCGPRRSRSRCWRAACAAARGPRGRTPSATSRRRRGDPSTAPGCP